MVDQPPTLPDAELVLLIRGGGESAKEAEEQLCQRMASRVRMYLARRHRDPYAVEDTTHDVLLALLEGIRQGRLDDPAKVGSYALGICKNKLREDTRREIRRHRALLRTGSDGPVEMALPRLQVGRLEECLLFLLERDRVLLRMIFCGGRSAVSIGEELGLKPQSVRVRRHRVIDKLRQCLGVGRYEAQR